MLKLHRDIVSLNILGVGKKVVSIYDGDVEPLVKSKKAFNNLPKGFLPIPSVEKYMYNKLIVQYNPSFAKYIGDRFYTLNSIDNIIQDYNNDLSSYRDRDSNGKKLYKLLIDSLERINRSEQSLIESICDYINEYESYSIDKFAKSLKNLIS